MAFESEYKKYLQTQQYKDASNLSARAQFQVRFATNPYGWFPWVFDQFMQASLPPEAALLELGGGAVFSGSRQAVLPECGAAPL